MNTTPKQNDPHNRIMLLARKHDAELELAIRRIAEELRRFDRRFVVQLSYVLRQKAERNNSLCRQTLRVCRNECKP